MSDATPAPMPADTRRLSGDPEFDRDYDVQHWRPLVNWLLAIPQWIVLYVLGIVAGVLWFISFFIVLFTKRNPFFGFQTMILRYKWRVFSFCGVHAERVPAVRLRDDARARGLDPPRSTSRTPAR